jgi:predicted acyltransferase
VVIQRCIILSCKQDRRALTAAVLYAVGFGTLALRELFAMAETAWGWSLAALFGIMGGAATAIAIVITVVAVLAILAAAIIEVREEQLYRAQHANALLS